MNTRQLRHFLAVMELGSLSAAAQSVHLSQPALSRSLRALEDELRVPLFDRTDRRLRPTPYALAYAERARRIVFDAREGARELQVMRAGEFGPLSFGMGSSLAAWLLGPMLLKLMHDAPRLKLRALVRTSDLLIEELVRERLDFFVGDVRVAEQAPEMAVEPVYRCTFGWFAARNHPLAGKRRIGAADLQAFPLAAGGYLDESLMRSFSQLYALQSPMLDQFSVVTDDVTTLRKLIAGSNAVIPATDLAVVDAMRAGEVTALDVHPPLELDMTLGILRRQGRTLVPAADRAFEIIRAHFAEATREIAILRGYRRRRA
jgi:DNA-binding transcriptional LysR family regulator